ncbi:MAG: DUF58 domain-containing protein [Chloroflexi bacterium HGW-Chloroflexi-9]|nr:MAG: DUF58 domain-containing protein [Chloroflexi bacterium HGW-Chloroflexi-9]
MADVPIDPAIEISAALMGRVRSIEIRTRRLAASDVSGSYRSVFRGAGIEFAEAREYVPGDDIRRIDWNVTARTGVPWVKEYVEERDLTVVCAVDRSASMLAAHGAGGRVRAAAELVALLGFAAAYNHDRTALLTFSDGIEAFVPPKRGPRHVIRQIRDVLQADLAAGKRTAMTPALEYLGRVLGRRSVIFLISDFLDDGYEAALQTLARRHEVIALTLIDPLDEALPDLGLIELEDVERGGRLLVDTGDARTREAYAERARARTLRRQETLARAGVDEIAVRLDRDAVDPVSAYFRRRARAVSM